MEPRITTRISRMCDLIPDDLLPTTGCERPALRAAVELER